MAEAIKTISDYTVNFDKIRDDFPVLNQQVMGKPLVYLDNAASSQMPQTVIDRINRYHSSEHANVHRGIHTLSQKATDEFELARKKVQKLINAEYEHEIVYTTGTTDSINLVANSFGRKFFSEGDEILISEIEHHANIVSWQLIGEQTGAKLKVIPVNDDGELIWEEYVEALNENTAIVAITHVSNALGTINPVKEIVAEAHKHDIPVLLDGAQAAPHSKIDVQDIDCDFYAFSAHKMCGPTGFGILYGKEKWLEQIPPFRGGGEMIDKVTFEETTYNRLPYKFETGTPPIAAGIGYSTAIDYLNDIGMEQIAAREQELLDYGTEQLQKIEGLRIIGTAKEKASVLSFVFDDIHATDVGTILDQQGIAIRTGHHCAQPSMRRFDVPATARASLSFYNNKVDIDRLVEGIKKAKELF
ncbi:cysteine desulfurase [Aliifodinibius sp. S!AR15-10]|uniref:cysteine desulfurase n=1 Tax=Aliifodinibius sp. S!AR15-10 TaxID=2950437 RepID=UPI00286598DD|nr:cysteine desulfurase [Aliifodinibius sp. S!AR15-10]MDR8391045.1 cysteine desulfurase [Aliifodinibius sp. S!AR15-10]